MKVETNNPIPEVVKRYFKEIGRVHWALFTEETRTKYVVKAKAIEKRACGGSDAATPGPSARKPHANLGAQND